MNHGGLPTGLDLAAVHGAHHDTQAGLLQPVGIVVVCVPHRPTTLVTSGVGILSRVRHLAVSVWPHIERVVGVNLKNAKKFFVISDRPP